MKDILKISFMFCLVVVVFIFKDNISTFIMDNIIYKGSNKVLTYNEYYLDYNYTYVQNIDTTDVESYQEILNMFYTILNSGDNSYSFDCNYDNCITDVKNLISDNTVISHINNFVHPFNTFSSINIDVSNNGKISVKVKKAYNDEEIEYIKAYVNEFITSNITEEMNDYDKIKLFHDHIINNTEYDKNNIDEDYTAYNLLISGKSICGGYSDIMSIFLNTIGIQNYKVTSDSHVWNLVKLENVWYHLDVTWDDPVASDGNQYLIHNFFLITNSKLHTLDKVEHNFDTNIYVEAR